MQSGAPNNIEPTLENILQLVKQLPRPEVARLREILSETLHETVPPRDRQVEPIIPQADFSLSVKWLAEHETEYAGQWVALDGDRLIAHGQDVKEVYAAAAASAVKYPMVTQVEDPNAPPFAGF
jgi:hypothetical protein